MRRQLISYNAFNRIEKESLSHAAVELAAAEEILSEVLNVDNLKLHCFDSEAVFYETLLTKAKKGLE